MSIIIGSARADENYKYAGGRRGDQRQKSSHDTSGEVSMQNFYVHKEGWYILRPKSIKHANAIAKSMKDACNNKHIGYSQSDRYSIFNNKGIRNADIKEDVNCDCSSLVRKCILDGTGVDVGDFNTVSESSLLAKTGLFESKIPYNSNEKLYDGDVLVTKTKGHTVIVVSGNPRVQPKVESTHFKNSGASKTSYTIGKKYTVKSEINMTKGPGTTNDIVTVLKAGDKVTCRQVKHIYGATWISNGAGWVCATSSGGKVYVG